MGHCIVEESVENNFYGVVILRGNERSVPRVPYNCCYERGNATGRREATLFDFLYLVRFFSPEQYIQYRTIPTITSKSIKFYFSALSS